MMVWLLNAEATDRDLDPERTEDRDLDPERTEDRDLDPERTEDRDLDPERTEDRDLDPERTEDRDLDPERTEDRDLDPERTEDRDLDPERTEDRDLDPERTEDRDLDPERTEDRDLDPECTEDQGQTTNVLSPPRKRRSSEPIGASCQKKKGWSIPVGEEPGPSLKDVPVETGSDQQASIMSDFSNLFRQLLLLLQRFQRRVLDQMKQLQDMFQSLSNMEPEILSFLRSEIQSLASFCDRWQRGLASLENEEEGVERKNGREATDTEEA
ncbi:unnamed protein product [Arctogadus glacialis]